MDAGIHELTAGYALDALDPEERDAYEAHLPRCERCQVELAAFSEVAGALAVAATGPAPPPGLRERILADARAEPANVIPLRTRHRTTPVLAAAGAIAAVAAIVLGLYALSLDGKLGDARTALSQQEKVTAVLSDPTARTVGLDSGEGRVVVAPDGDAVLVLNGMGALPEGKTYQAWVIGADGKPLPAGTFEPDEGTAVVAVAEAVPEQGVVAVTVESDGGATTPTSPIVAASEPV
jgi:anti-sigma-K factor RskA